MLTFRSKKTKTEYVSLLGDVKDWRDAGLEIEALGNRLDTVRMRVKACKPGTWAHRHWQEVEQIMLNRWKMMVIMHRSGLKQRGPRTNYPIDYQWWEGGEEMGAWIPGLFEFTWVNNLIGNSGGNLDRAWAKAQEEKLQKARQGLA